MHCYRSCSGLSAAKPATTNSLPFFFFCIIHRKIDNGKTVPKSTWFCAAISRRFVCGNFLKQIWPVWTYPVKTTSAHSCIQLRKLGWITGGEYFQSSDILQTCQLPRVSYPRNDCYESSRMVNWEWRSVPIYSFSWNVTLLVSRPSNCQKYSPPDICHKE